MACRAAVIVPALGGASSFARHGENALLVDTTQPAGCLQALASLVQDTAMRRHLARAALTDAVRFHTRARPIASWRRSSAGSREATRQSGRGWQSRLQHPLCRAGSRRPLTWPAPAPLFSPTAQKPPSR